VKPDHVAAVQSVFVRSCWEVDWNEVHYWTVCVYYRIFCKEKPYRKCIHKFRRKYPDSPVLTASYVSKLVEKWRATGSVSHNLFMWCDAFFNQLTAEETQHGYFQQDSATAHTANATMVVIREVFEDRIISGGLWPPRSPDLSFCDFYLWGNLKGKVYKNILHSIEALQAEIKCVIGSIAVDKLQKVSHNLFTHCKACLQAEGGHFQHLL
jgi:hypothetical protein